ncbi:MAG: class B sortase [Oscillospiraceae bacterium]|nr:class B sortase [Oscillospiraceae bacterium]
MNSGRRTLILILGVLLLGIVLGVAAFGVHQALQPHAVPTPEPTPTPTAAPTPEPTPTPTPTPEPTPTPYVSPIDFESLWKINPHVIGWLDIPGTNIQYPILQHPSQDDYYLDVTIEGNHGYPGSVYTNLLEGQHFDTFNTVIYGHNMADGSMFADLRHYGDRSYMQTHRDLVIYTPTEEHHYTVCANVIYSDLYVTMVYDDNVPADREAFLRSLHNNSAGTYWMDDVEVTTDSRIVTLQTCIGQDEYRRFIIAVEQKVIPEVSVVTPSGDGGAEYSGMGE